MHVCHSSRRSLPTVAVLLLLVAGGCAPSDPKDHSRHVLSVAGVFPTSIEEPWPQVVDEAFRQVAESGRIEYQAEYGIGTEQFEEALHRAADAGNDIVVADSFAAEEAARRIAAEHPRTLFFLGSSLGAAEPNVSVFDSWLQEAAYLAGMAAGDATRSHRVGVVAAMQGAETNRVLNGFRAGLLETDPTACLAVRYTGTWFDVDGAAEAGRALIEAGSDVLYAERLGAEQAAMEAGVPVIGNFQDHRAMAPDVTLTSVLWNMRPAVEHMVLLIEHEKFHSDLWRDDATADAPGRFDYVFEDYGSWSNLVMGGSSLAPWGDLGDRFNTEHQSRIEARRREILSGTFRVPIVELPVPECEEPKL